MNFSHFLGSDESITMRDQKICGSGLWSVWDPVTVLGVLGWFR